MELPVDNIRFQLACEKASSGQTTAGIGTLGEKKLHAVLKNYYEPYEENQEVKIGGFVADICAEDGIIEIQTRNLGSLNKKLAVFLDACRVTVVHPIPCTKWLFWIDKQSGEVSKRRKSPRQGRIYDAVPEMYRIKFILANPRLTLRLCFVDIEEFRWLDGWSENKKKGSTRCDRLPVAIQRDIVFSTPNDYLLFLPDNLPYEFTSKQLAGCAKISFGLAGTLLNILHYIGVVERTSRDKKGYHYKKAY